MKFLQTAHGYDIYELSADECKKNFRTFPLFCCFNAETTEPIDRELALSENEAETLEEMLSWCEKYCRNILARQSAPADCFPQASKLYRAWAENQNLDKFSLFPYITGEKLDAWLQSNCRDVNEFGGVWWLDTSTASAAEAFKLPQNSMGLIVKFEEITPGDLFTLDGYQHKLRDNVAAQTYDAQVVVKITAENIENIIVAALLLAGKTVKLYDVEDDSETWELTLEKLIKGIGREITNGFKLSDIEEEADAALQYALFDEVVYG